MVMKEIKLNKYLGLKLENNTTFIYIKDKPIYSCKKLILNITKEDAKLYDSIESIDEASEIYKLYQLQDKLLDEEEHYVNKEDYGIDFDLSPEEEFWAHTSNLQAWVEHDYDTRILKSDMAFPLLKKLADAGDPKARAVFKEEIAKRLASGYSPVIEYLFEQKYLRYLNNEEILFSLLTLNEAELLKNWEKQFNVYFNYMPKFYSQITDHYQLRIPKYKVVQMLRKDPSMANSSIEEMRNAMQKFYYKEERKSRSFTIQNKHITGLILNYCNLSEVPPELKELKNLENLNLSNNPLGRVPKWIKNFKKLRILKLNHSNLKKFPEEVLLLDSLEDLHLGGNKITEIPESIYSLPKLKELNLSLNPIKLEKIEELRKRFDVYFSDS